MSACIGGGGRLCGCDSVGPVCATTIATMRRVFRGIGEQEEGVGGENQVVVTRNNGGGWGDSC